MPGPQGEATTEYIVTFGVNRWFKGGPGKEVQLRSAIPLGPEVSSAEQADIELGGRYLASGDGGFVWSCGFTQPFSESAASEWATAIKALI